MSFSPDSEELMKLILPDFDNFLVKKTPIQQKKLDNILKVRFYISGVNNNQTKNETT